MPSGHKVSEEVEHAVQANKGIALLIAVLALFLAFASAGGKVHRRQQLAKTLRRLTCGLFIKLRPFVPPHY